MGGSQRPSHPLTPASRLSPPTHTRTYATPPQVQAFFQEICGTPPCMGPLSPAVLGHNSPRGKGAPPVMLPHGRQLPRNILSFGDSVHERAAIQKVTSAMGPGVLTKSIKFVERPTVEQLKRQVDLVGSCFESIVQHADSLDLMLTIHLLYQ